MTTPETPDPTATLTIAVGPSFATAQSMIAANQANGLMYYNAVANQQMGNIVGMVTTMNCVQQLLGHPQTFPFPTLPMANAKAATDTSELTAEPGYDAKQHLRHQLQLIQQTGIALCVAAIAREPEKVDVYTQAIQKIRKALE